MRDDDLHTCLSECPCQTGGEPPRDFLPVEEAVPRLGWYGYLLHLSEACDATRND